MPDSRSRSNRRLLLAWVVLGVIALAVVLVLTFGDPAEGPDPRKHPAIGRQLPQLELQPLTGLPSDAPPVQGSDLQGQVTLLNFWGTWCPPCVVELPHIAELWEKYGDEEAFRLYAVSSGTSGDTDLEELREETKRFLDDMKIEMPTYADQNQFTRRGAATAEAFNGYPTTILLDRQGVIRGVWQGYSQGVEKQIDRLIADLLEEGPQGR